MGASMAPTQINPSNALVQARLMSMKTQSDAALSQLNAVRDAYAAAMRRGDVIGAGRQIEILCRIMPNDTKRIRNIYREDLDKLRATARASTRRVVFGIVAFCIIAAGVAYARYTQTLRAKFQANRDLVSDTLPTRPEQVQAVSVRSMISEKLAAELSRLGEIYAAVSQKSAQQPLLPKSAVSDERIRIIAKEIERSIPFLKLSSDSGIDALATSVVEKYVLVMMDPKKAAAVAELNAKDGGLFVRTLIYFDIDCSAAAKYGFAPNIIRGKLAQEGRRLNTAYSVAGAEGQAQLMPKTALLIGVNDPTDPFQAIPGGANHLKSSQDFFLSNLEFSYALANAIGLKWNSKQDLVRKLTLMDYNAGRLRLLNVLGRERIRVLLGDVRLVKKVSKTPRPLPGETQDYPGLVMWWVARFDIIFPDGMKIPPTGTAPPHYASHQVPDSTHPAMLSRSEIIEKESILAQQRLKAAAIRTFAMASNSAFFLRQ